MPQILVHLISARNLVAADSNGLSDPYVKLRVGSGAWKKSKVIPKTLNPNWNESFILNVSNPETDSLELRVFDKDLIVDDSIGKATLTLINLQQGLEKEYSLTLDGVKNGEVQLILTALDFGAKKEEVVIKPRSEHPTLPLPMLGVPGQGSGARSPKGGSSPRNPQPPSPPALQSPPTHSPRVIPSTESIPVSPKGNAPSPRQEVPPLPTQPLSPMYSPQYYQQPQGYAPQGFAPYYATPPYQHVLPPPVVQQPLSARLGEIDQVKQTPVTDTFEFGKQLGQGAFAVVFEGMRKANQELVAIKCIDKSRVAGANIKLMRREVLNLLQLDHPNIMKLYEIYEDQQKFYLILELIKGKELFDKIVALGHYSEHDAAHIMQQALAAIAYLHSKGIAHRDLKPENLLSIGAGEAEVIKLADFGLSKNFSEEEMSTSCGSPLYVAPEVLTGRGYTKAVDVWSLGVILYITLVGYPPFNGPNAVVLYRQIMHNEWGFGPAWSSISADARELVQRMMCYDGMKRITALEALEHPWIKQRAAASKTPLPTQSELKKTMQQK